MLSDTIDLLPLSTIQNVHIETGTTLPLDPGTGRLYFLSTSVSPELQKGFYVFDGASWQTGDITRIDAGDGLIGGGDSGIINLEVDSNILATVTNFTNHAADASIHISSTQDTWLAGITATSTEVNYVSGVTSAIQTQINGKINLTGDTVTGVLVIPTGNKLTITDIPSVGTDAANKTYVDTKTGTNAQNLTDHSSDATIHLTPGQNTLIDGITATSAEINYSVGVTSGIQTQINSKLNLSGGTMTGNLVMSTTTKITIIDSPLVGSDAVNKDYVDSNLSGLHWKTAAQAATTANITLSGTQTIDGIAVIVGNRVLVKDQTIPSQNGIYIVSATAWTRSTDMDSTTPTNEFNSAAVFIEDGTVNKSYGYTQVNTVTTVGTDPVAFSLFQSPGGITQEAADLRYTNVTGDTMTGLLTLSGDPTTNLQAATKQYVDNFREIPVGTRMLFAQDAAPTGWTRDISDSATNRFLRVTSVTGVTGGNAVGGTHDPVTMNVVPIHTHGITTGNESVGHTHTITTGGNSVGHTHTFTSGNPSLNHTHSGTTGGHSVDHAHYTTTGTESADHAHYTTTGGISANHTHTFSDTSSAAGSHSHTFSFADSNSGNVGGNALFTGYVNDGPAYNNTSNTVAAHTHAISGTTSTVSADHTHAGWSGGRNAAHTHAAWSGGASVDHTHAFTTGTVSSWHTHSGTTDAQSVAHTHSGTTADRSAAHTHSGTTDSGSSQTNWTPRYLNIIVCTKD